ncbi:MAG: methyltransferase domain-containing protein [Armatimonadetes bacterium]|nr:methyltransferase domain-containing protein [Armatimonadota bacterium]
MATPARPFAQSLFDGVAAWLSYGQYRRWRRFVTKWIRADGLVLDLATGTGAIALDFARRGPGTVVGVDQSAGMLASGRDVRCDHLLVLAVVGSRAVRHRGGADARPQTGR